MYLKGRRRSRRLARLEENQQHQQYHLGRRRDNVFGDCVKRVVVNDVELYEPVLGDTPRDNFVLDLLANAVSFRKVEAIGTIVQNHLGKVPIIYPSCTRERASRIASAACLVSLQLLHEIAQEYSWVNAIASDSSYLDDLQMDLLGVRARFGIDCEVHSFHLAAVPLFDTHTSDDVMRALKPLLNALDDDWWVKIAGSTTDGENKMTGVHVGVSTQLEQEARDAGATDEFVRIWDPCHQLDLALHRALDGIAGVPDEKTMKRTDILIPESHPTSIYYMKRLRELATTLRAKKYAINATRKTGHHINCPGMSKIRWATILGVSKYVDKRQEEVQGLQQNRLCGMPEPLPGEWWVMNAFMTVATTIWRDYMHKMQRDLLTLEEQHRHASGLEDALIHLLEDAVVVMPSDPRPNDVLRTTGQGVVKLSQIGPYRIRHAAALSSLTKCCATALLAFPADRDRVTGERGTGGTSAHVTESVTLNE
eukprot:GHVU01150883.1.p1 GENE.GHVU01150883.1~~GHVU01150883.1.p1  ORF type:complete len:480 (+),score=54.42 GHVU01150883.1:153-1592(+)